MQFSNQRQLERLIDVYFKHIAGEFHFEDAPAKGKGDDAIIRQKVWDREPEPPTISGLALHLGFASRQEFELYIQAGEFAAVIKRGRLRIEAEYEKKLHQQPSGAIFALKNLGWNERDNLLDFQPPQPLQIQIVDSGVPVAANEGEVII